jgi:hypothetical protein
MSSAVAERRSASGSKRKKSEVGFAVEDNLPEYLHYMGNPPKENSAAPGFFSSPVIPFYSNAFNYGHWIFQGDDGVLVCVKCHAKISTDLSNAIKHVIRTHPEVAAWEDVAKNSSSVIMKYKLDLERLFQPKRANVASGAVVDSAGGNILFVYTNYFFEVISFIVRTR